MREWEDKLPPLMRERLARIGAASPEEKARVKELGNLNSLLAEFFKGTLDSEGLYERLKEYESRGKQFLLKEARETLENSFRGKGLRMKFEEVGGGSLTIHLLKEEEVKREEEDLVIELTGDKFDQALRKHPLLVVDCWAEWCAPCKMVAPVIEELARDYWGRIAFGKLNVDRNQMLAMEYRIMSIPTLLMFKDGQLKDQIVGAMPRKTLEPQLARYIGEDT